MSGVLTGMAVMATLALGLRWSAAPPVLREALLWLAGLAAVLALLFLSDLVDLAGWETSLLPLLPVFLMRHMEALVALPMRRWQKGAAAAGLILLPDQTPLRLVSALGSFAVFYLALTAVTVASALCSLRALHRHKAQFAQVVAAPASLRLDGVAVLGLFVGFVFLGHLAGLLLAGIGVDLFPGLSDDVFSAIVVLGITLHGLTLDPLLPDWADKVIAAPAPAYARSGLDDEARQRLLGRLDGAMQAGHLWRNPMLTLKDLATEARAKTFYVSQALNQGRGVSFFDYVNGWRVREACSLLATTDKTILEIAESVGFNAKSTFNAAFRKITGITPSAWRQSAPSGQVDRVLAK